MEIDQAIPRHQAILELKPAFRSDKEFLGDRALWKGRGRQSKGFQDARSVAGRMLSKLPRAARSPAATSSAKSAQEDYSSE